jgi:hypothetical protein
VTGKIGGALDDTPGFGRIYVVCVWKTIVVTCEIGSVDGG